MGEPRADILPADMAVGVDFDQAAKSRFAKEGVTIGQALRGAHERSVECFLQCAIKTITKAGKVGAWSV